MFQQKNIASKCNKNNDENNIYHQKRVIVDFCQDRVEDTCDQYQCKNPPNNLQANIQSYSSIHNSHLKTAKLNLIKKIKGKGKDKVSNQALKVKKRALEVNNLEGFVEKNIELAATYSPTF